MQLNLLRYLKSLNQVPIQAQLQSRVDQNTKFGAGKTDSGVYATYPPFVVCCCIIAHGTPDGAQEMIFASLLEYMYTITNISLDYL